MLAAAVTVLLTCVLPLAQDPRYYFYGDTPAAYYGWWFHLGEQVRAGHLPVLDPHAWAAGNLAAEGQWGLYSPLVVALGLLADLSANALVLATAVKIALVVVGALGVFTLARSYDAPPAAAYVAAVAVPLGGMTQYLDVPSWVAGLMIWALLPWVWWALRRLMLGAGGPLPALGLGYLLVTVGYVYGTIMLIWVLLACLLECRLAEDRVARLRVLGVGACCGLVAVAVYLPGVLTASVTNRNSQLGGFGGKFSTDPLAMFTSLLPTASVHDASVHLLPYTYAVWFLPVLLWVDVDRVRRGWRPVAGLLFMAVVTLVIVDGPSRLGPLRWPLRLQTFLVQMLVLLCVVAVLRFAVRRPSRRRLLLALGWVLVAGVVAVVRVPGMWQAHLLSVLLVAAGTATLWALLRADRRRVGGIALVATAFTVGSLLLQRAYYPTPPSPQRNPPVLRADYRTQLPGARGDVLVVGDPEPQIETEPAESSVFLVGSAWYLNPHRVQNTYTTIGFHAYSRQYCIEFQGATCAALLATLFTTEPTTGMLRVDLLSVSTLLLVRDSFPERNLFAAPAGWHVKDSTRWSVTWVRDRPLASAGAPEWVSGGATVKVLSQTDREVRVRVGRVPPAGATVAFSRIAWPGYHTDEGALTAPVDGYLLTLRVPARAAGRVVTVGFSPPGWGFELACLWLALVSGAAWSTAVAVRRRRSRVP